MSHSSIDYGHYGHKLMGFVILQKLYPRRYRGETKEKPPSTEAIIDGDEGEGARTNM
jgi:hypothetical protein